VANPKGDLVPAAAGILSDRSLLRRFRLGHEDAATELYRRYAPRLRQLARRQCAFGLGQRLDADDIVQSVFCDFFQGARKGCYDIPEGEDLWRLMLVIGLNKVRAKRTFHQAAKRDVRLTASDQCLKSQGHSGGWRREFLRLAFVEALMHLEAPERDMVELLLQGHDVGEIADKVGRSKRTVERNLQAVRQKLSRLLVEEFSHGQ
jgi:RNA polymerase sigma-70 factor (ECF subfamily)